MKNTRFVDLSVGVCICHDCCIGEVAVVVTHSTDTFDNNRGQNRFTDISICAHPGIVVTYSPDVYINNLQAARLGDLVVGCIINVLITGSGDTFVND